MKILIQQISTHSLEQHLIETTKDETNIYNCC